MSVFGETKMGHNKLNLLLIILQKKQGNNYSFSSLSLPAINHKNGANNGRFSINF